MEFNKWPKIPRLNRDMVITEKIDGTNAQICIADTVTVDQYVIGPETADYISEVKIDVGGLHLFAGSRNRWLSEKKDNFGFWKWARENAKDLLNLGPGRHYGEWWGQGIQRKYDLKEKRFSLFNLKKWGDERPDCCHVVPVLYEGPFNTDMIDHVVWSLEETGSHAAQGFMDPEGVCVFHAAAHQLFKVTIKNDEVPKGQAR